MELEHFEGFMNQRIQNLCMIPNVLFGVAAGEIDGVSSVFKFGRNESIGTTEEVVWPGS